MYDATDSRCERRERGSYNQTRPRPRKLLQRFVRKYLENWPSNTLDFSLKSAQAGKVTDCDTAKSVTQKPKKISVASTSGLGVQISFLTRIRGNFAQICSTQTRKVCSNPKKFDDVQYFMQGAVYQEKMILVSQELAPAPLLDTQFTSKVANQ